MFLTQFHGDIRTQAKKTQAKMYLEDSRIGRIHELFAGKDVFISGVQIEAAKWFLQ